MQIKLYKRLIFSFLFLFSLKNLSIAQDIKTPFLVPRDSLDKKRTRNLTIVGTAGYSGLFILLSRAWYSKYDQTKFHLFNDNKEWLQIDKGGHIFTAYFQAEHFYKAYRWSGVKPKTSAYIGLIGSTIFQGTLEFSDGFQKKWGFSLGDMAANATGSLLFVGQELAWHEQRFRMKFSNTPRKYPQDKVFSQDGLYQTSIYDRANSLYGKPYYETFLKDYNAQTIWLSANIRSFFSDSRVPKWLNLAVGYGAENLYVGDPVYQWTQEKTSNGIPSGTSFSLDKQKYPRYRQYYLALDVDVSKIHLKNRFLNTLLHVVGSLKFPAPALEINSQGKVFFHPIQY